MCERSILKTNEPICTNGSWGNGVKQSTLEIRRSTIKVTWGKQIPSQELSDEWQAQIIFNALCVTGSPMWCRRSKVKVTWGRRFGDLEQASVSTFLVQVDFLVSNCSEHFFRVMTVVVKRWTLCRVCTVYFCNLIEMDGYSVSILICVNTWNYSCLVFCLLISTNCKCVEIAGLRKGRQSKLSTADRLKTLFWTFLVESVRRARMSAHRNWKSWVEERRLYVPLNSWMKCSQLSTGVNSR